MVSDPLVAYLFTFLLFALACFRPQWAVLACIAILPSYLLKLQMFGIPTTVLELSIWATFVGAFLSNFFSPMSSRLSFGVREISSSKFFWPILTFAAVSFISAIAALHQQTALGGWKAWVFDPILFALLLIQLFSVKGLWKIAASLGVSSTVLSAYGIYEYVILSGQLGDGRLDSIFDPANYHALFVGPIIVLLVGFLASPQTPRIWKICFSIASAVNIFALIFTFSYGGFLATLGGVVLFGFLALNPVWRKRIFWGSVTLFFSFVLLLSPTKKFQDLFEFQNRSSSHARVEIWKTSALITKEHPMLGVGLNDFEYHYRQTIPRVAFPPLEWLVAQPHNLYFALLTQIGVLGLLAFAWIIVRFFQLIRITCHEQRAVSYALLAAMTTTLLHGFVDTPYFKNDLAVLFWVVIAMGIILFTALRARGGLEKESKI